MQEDPILTEMRTLRDEYAASLNHDAEAIYRDILRRQHQSSRKLVRYRPREPRVSAEEAEHNAEHATAERQQSRS
jgi:hypothetical protein